MTDKRDNDKGRPRKPGGDKSGRSFRKEGGPGRSGPRKPREDGEKRSFKPREERGERSFRPREDRGERSFRPREERSGERPFRKREEGERSFRPREDRGGERSFRKREEGERSFRPREDRGGERGFRPREDRGGERPFRKREDAPRFGARAGDGNRPMRRQAPPKPASSIRTVERAAGEERIAKVMARVGLCSRRDAEAWIAQGRVAVNGTVIDSPALNVGPKDRVTVDGVPLGPRERTRLWLFHKPRGYVTTSNDPEGRATIFDVLPTDLPRVVTIGRLDINTEGLLLLTNDGGLARVLELPSTGWLRRYRVRAHGDTDQAQLDTLRKGITVDGIDYQGIEATLDRVQGANSWLTLGLREGKNREVKRVLESLGLDVNRLIRISYGPFQLGELAEGAVEEIKTRILKDQLGDALALEAGADFEAPILERDEDDSYTPRPRFESRRPQYEDEEEERKPREKPAPRSRKHVSTLREEKSEGARKGPRKRIERQETADRRGRAVKVERVVPAEKKEERGGSRNARRFASERAPRDEGAERRERSPRSRDDRAPRDRNERGGDRPFRKPREEGERSFRPREERAPRGERSFEKRDGGFKGKRDFKPREDRGPRSERPAGGRPSGGRPSGGRPGGGRPGGDRPRGGTGGKRPGGPRRER